jgi:riboflavin synthase
MFTGIISHTSAVRLKSTDDTGMTLTFDRPADWSDLKEGESIATSGICLTIAALRDNEYDCVVIPETIARTSFGQKLPETVNLERALSASGRLDGHFVQGHVDDVGRISAIDRSDGFRLSLTFDPKHRNLVVDKGSITIDGVALTIAAVNDTSLTVALIPHTLEQTTIPSLKVGDLANLEFDIIGKYVINSLKPYPPSK